MICCSLGDGIGTEILYVVDCIVVDFCYGYFSILAGEDGGCRILMKLMYFGSLF